MPMFQTARYTETGNRWRYALACACGALLLCLGAAAQAQPLPLLVPYNAGDLWGYADTTGRVRIAPQWLSAQFFSGGKALVGVAVKAGQRAAFGLIDTDGRYIISPELRWTGRWNGSWSKTEFNAFDSAGRMGLVDDAGNLLIPREWDGDYPMQGTLADSFRIVHRDGLAGIVDRQGRIVEPAKWGSIQSNETLAAIRAFQVVDPDNTAGNNSTGIADLSGRLLIPPRYSGISLRRRAGGMLFFEVSRMASNERMAGNTDNVYAAPRFFDYSSGRQIPDPGAAAPASTSRGFPLPGGFFDKGQSLVDSSGKIIVPCCRFIRLSGDTVVLRDVKPAGEDSLALRIEYLHVRSMKRLAPTRSMILYVNSEEEKRRDEYRYNVLSYRGNQQEAPSIMIRDYGRVSKFYKDSFLFSVVTAADDAQRFFIVSGIVPGSRWGSAAAAVVDTGFHYLMQPRAGRDILDYDHREQLATIRRYNPVSRFEEQLLVTPDRDERVLLRLRRGNIVAGYRWQGRVYAHIHIQDECDPGPSGAQHYIADSSGVPLAAFGAYKLLETNPARPGYTRVPGQIRVIDSAKRIGMLRPDGSPVFPALNFRYQSLDASLNGWFLAGSTGVRGLRLFDSAGRSVLPEEMTVQQLAEVNLAAQYYGEGPVPEPVFGLYRLSVQDRTGTSRFMYIDRHGRLYHAPL